MQGGKRQSVRDRMSYTTSENRMGETEERRGEEERDKTTLKGNIRVCVCDEECVHSRMAFAGFIWAHSPWVCEHGRSLCDDRAGLGGGQNLLGCQAAAGGHHGAMRLGMLQRVGLRVVQRRLGVGVLELELGFELVHAGWPIMRKRLQGRRSAVCQCGM